MIGDPARDREATLRDHVAREIFIQHCLSSSWGKRDQVEQAWDKLQGQPGRRRWLDTADAVLTVIVERGGNKQLRQDVRQAIVAPSYYVDASGYVGSPLHQVEAVMHVVALAIVAERERIATAIEQAAEQIAELGHEDAEGPIAGMHDAAAIARKGGEQA